MKHLLILITLILALCLPAFAQDATEAAQATADAPVVINVQPAETPTSTDGSLWGYVIVIGGVIVTGFVGLSFILQGIGNRAQAAAQNPLEIAVIEKVYDSIPSAVVTAIIDPLKASLERSDAALKQVLEFLQKASDKVPESEKPVQPIIGVNTYPQGSGSAGVVAGRYSGTLTTPTLDPTSYTVSSSAEPPQA